MAAKKTVLDPTPSAHPGLAQIKESSPHLTVLEAFLLSQHSITYTPYYNGKMSFALAGEQWKQEVKEIFPDITNTETSENIFKDAIDMYVSTLMPSPKELKGFIDTLVPLLCRGEAPAVVTPDKKPIFPEQYEMISDGDYTVAAIFTRSLLDMMDHLTFVDSNGVARLYSKPVPNDLANADRLSYQFVKEEPGYVLFRFALDDKGIGGSLAALQDRANHSILDETAIAEMYARPFWYLMNVELPAPNPYLPASSLPEEDTLKERSTPGSSARLFTTSAEGPFGQLDPPSLGDIVSYHDSLISKVSQSTGIPEFYFRPGSGEVPSGVALKVLTSRYNHRVSRIRDNIEDQLRDLCALLGVQKEEGESEIVLWDGSDDLLQEALDQHGLNLATMGMPLKYIAEVVAPGIDMEDYMDDGFAQDQMQANLPTPDQVAAYAANPGQEAGKPAINPLHPSTGNKPTLTPVD